MKKMQTIQEADFKNKRILLRTDYNVPIKNGVILGDKRIRESLPTIAYLIDNGAKEITIITHLGKPDGKNNPDLSLYPVANKLAELLKIDVSFNESAGEYQISDKIKMRENLRFDSGEEKNDKKFAKELVKNQDVFVNDAFGTCHRAHASTVGVTELLPSYAGLLVQKEVNNLDDMLKSKARPFTVILGGAKIEDKLPMVKNMMTRADNFLFGGAIADTFLVARRHFLGKSLVEETEFRDANIIYQNLRDETDRNIYLPKDLVISKSMKESIESKTIKVADTLDPEFMKDYISVDIGEKTTEEYRKIILQSKTIFWNGNMGVSEVEQFARGTKEIAVAISETGANAIIGGGDTVAAFEELNIKSDKIFLSTGGGATLEYLAGKFLPGLKALE